MKPVDFCDKLLSRTFQYFSPVSKRRRLAFDEYINELKDEPFVSKASKFILSIDDLSPLGIDSNEADLGGISGSQVSMALQILIESEIRPTIYYIPNASFKKSSELISTFSRPIDRELDNKYIDYNKRNLIELSQHGFSHARHTLRGTSRSMEFEWQSTTAINSKINLGYLAMLGQNCEPFGFKPPAWSIGQLNQKFNLLSSYSLRNYQYLSMSSPTNGLNYQSKSVSHIHLSQVKTTDYEYFNVPQNLSILYSYDQARRIIDLIAERGGIINLQTHATMDKSLTADGLSHDELNKILKIYEYINDIGLEHCLTKKIFDK